MRKNNIHANNNPRVGSKKSRGQGAVEFALTLPILLMVMLGIMEFGRLMFVYSSVVSAAREAARYGAASGLSDSGKFYYQDCDGIRGAAVQIGSIAAINQDTGVDIQYDRGPDEADTIAASCPFNGTGPGLARGDRIIVTVTSQFQPTQGLVPLPSLSVSSTVKRSVLVNIEVN